MIKIAFHTLGCKVNQYESEALMEAFAKRGAEIVPETEIADVYLVNTCSVTSIADRKSRQFIRRMKKKNPHALMVVTGCYAQVSSEELEAMPDVDLIMGNNLKSEIPDRVCELLQARENSETAVPQKRKEVLAYRDLRGYEDMGIVTASESEMSRAYIKIQEGCNRFCSYCLIPYARGVVRSRPLEEVLEEAKMLLNKGFRELVLTGINTALYGTEPEFDFQREPGEEGLNGLEAVIRRLDAMEGDFRIRLSSLEPTVVDIEHIERIVQYDKLCHHLHLSLQSGSDAILESMNRHYNREDYFKIVRSLRDFDPYFGITTDIIVGFPGETEEDFLDTLSLVREVEYDSAFTFIYSPRVGTPAAKYDEQIPENIKHERFDRLVEEVNRCSAKKNSEYLGKIVTVMVDGPSKNDAGAWSGRTDTFKLVNFTSEEPLTEGQMVSVRITETKTFSLDGKKVDA